MKQRSFLLALVALFSAATTGFGQNTHATGVKPPDYGKVPLCFELNQGQSDSQVKFLAHGEGYTLFLTQGEVVLASKNAAALRMKFVGANRPPVVSGVEELGGKSNYFLGSDPKRWHANVPTYAKVRYQGIYNGIDVVYYGNQRQLEYDLVVAPGADPRRIRLDLHGATKIHRSETGELVVHVGKREIRWHKPVVYQESAGVRREIDGEYVITGKNRVGFAVAGYDKSKTLVIDPVLVYSTFLGGTGGGRCFGVAVDSSGEAFITGETASSDFPTVNALQPKLKGYANAFVSKLNPSGSALVYSTYLGGSGSDDGLGIAVDSSGDAYVAGYTGSTDFPVVNPLQPNLGGVQNAFVSKINPSGSALVYSTYLGGSGSDGGLGIAVDSSGDAYVTGFTSSTDFPTINPFQPAFGGTYDAFVAKFNPGGSALVYSTYLGGSGDDRAYGVAVDGSGDAYVAGVTYSADLPTKNPFQAAYGGNIDAFVAEFNPSGSLVYSTYLGGSGGDEGLGIAVDRSGAVYVTGGTSSTNFPTLNPFQANLAGPANAFVTKLNPLGSSLAYSTYLGGSGGDGGSAIAVDSSGNADVTGGTSSTDFPTVNPLQSSLNGGPGDEDAFIAKLNALGSTLVFSTYLGGNLVDFGQGIAVDGLGDVYVTGYTSSTNFPTLNALQPTNNGGNGDGFVTKIGLPETGTTLHFSNTEWTFAPQVVGSLSGEGVVYVTNSGSTPASFSSASLVSSLAGLQFEDTCAPTLAPFTTCEVEFRLTAQTLGAEQGTLALQSDAPNSPNLIQINADGTGVHLSAPSWSFGPSAVGTTSGPGIIYLTNHSPAPMDLLSTVSLTGPNFSDFALTNNCSAAVAPYTTCSLSFTWTPLAAGARIAQINITSAAVQNGSVVIPITAEAL